MKLYRTVRDVTTFKLTSSPLLKMASVDLSRGTYLICARMEKVAAMVQNKFVFVISPSGEIFFLGSENVKEV